MARRDWMLPSKQLRDDILWFGARAVPELPFGFLFPLC